MVGGGKLLNIWSNDSLILFILFFVPGFISLKIYDLLIAKEQRDFSKSWFDAVGYSAINFALFYALIIGIIEPQYRIDHPARFPLLVALITIVAPALWPCLIRGILCINFVDQHVIAPIRRPWDYLFSRREPYYVIVHLKDGRRIAGKYGKDSQASVYPMEEQIYLQEIWTIDDETGEWNRVEGTKGIIILGKEILCLDLLEGSGENEDEQESR